MAARMTFKEWLYAQKDRKDPTGDLSRDTIDAARLSKNHPLTPEVPNFPKRLTRASLSRFVRRCNGIVEAEQAVTTAYAEYKKTILGTEALAQAE